MKFYLYRPAHTSILSRGDLEHIRQNGLDENLPIIYGDPIEYDPTNYEPHFKDCVGVFPCLIETSYMGDPVWEKGQFSMYVDSHTGEHYIAVPETYGL